MQSIEAKYMLPGMKPRSRPQVSPKQGRPEQSSLMMDDNDDEDDGVEGLELVKRSSVRNLDLLRAAPEMLQLLHSRSANQLRSMVMEPQQTRMKDEDTIPTPDIADQEHRTAIVQSFVPFSSKNINDHAIRLIQFTPEWSILVFIRYLNVEVVTIENSPFPNALGKQLPLLIHGNAVISGRFAILEYLNQFNHSSSFNFYYSPMACYIETNCYQNLQYFNHLTKNSRLQSSILMPWGLKYAYSWILEWWDQHHHSSHVLLSGCQEQDVLRRLDFAYQYLSSLIQPSSHRVYLVNASSPKAPHSEEDGLQLADILLYGHMAEALLTSNDSVGCLLRKYPLLIEAFNIDSNKFFLNCEFVSDSYKQ